MTLSIDPRIAVMLAAASAEPSVPHIRGDWRTLRTETNIVIATDFASAGPSPDVSSTDHEVIADDGTPLLLRWYARGEQSAGSAVVYAHGGGMISGSVEGYDPVVRQYVQRSGVPFLAVNYRLAPEHPGETPARDVLAGVRWLVTHAHDFGVEADRIAVMGDSAGGGVAAGVAVLARDEGLALARQILIYPMLDDRNTAEDPHISPWATWTYDMNYTGWRAILGDAAGSDDVSPVVAPARLVDFTGLAPAYVEVGTLDIFRDESIMFAQSLLRAGVDAELHVHPGSPHGQEWLGSPALAERCFADRARAIESI